MPLMNSEHTYTQALILFAHGSSNPTWRVPFDLIAQQVREQTQDICVELAFLEIMQPSIQSVVRAFAEQGIQFIRIVPLFFGVGKHVAQDLEHLVKLMRDEFVSLEIEVIPAIGQSQWVRDAIVKYSVT